MITCWGLKRDEDAAATRAIKTVLVNELKLDALGFCMVHNATSILLEQMPKKKSTAGHQVEVKSVQLLQGA